MLRFIKFLLISVSTTAGLLAVLLLVRAFDSRGMLDLGPEYRMEFEQEFTASDEDETDWAGYLAIEDALQDELHAKIAPEARPDSLLDRYDDTSLSFPGNFDANWNRSYELKSSSARGVAVMLHGLTDSPYSMLPTAQGVVGAGYDVVVPRMPGHGFAVSALLDADWQDWTAAVRLAVRHADTVREEGQPLLMVGYSNGALLALNYALRCKEDELPCPDRIIMLSPAIAVSAAARFANWHASLSWMPYFEKLKWLSILPEIDPFKFTSFPNRAASEIYRIAKRTHRLLKDDDRRRSLPPILTFQSVIDNTVSARAVVSLLYDRLPANGSSLVVYDINRHSTVKQLMKTVPLEPFDYFTQRTPLNYELTVVRNETQNSDRVEVQRLPAGEVEAEHHSTDLSWPLEVYSLSHVALPFPPFDQVYGEGRYGGRAHVVIGAMLARGEPGLLSLAPAYFLRLRNNPFFALQSDITRQWLDAAQ